MTTRMLALGSLLLLPALVFSQWTDRKRLGAGGESTVTTDGKGSVYVTCHGPTNFYISRDFGTTFADPQTFPKSLGDVHVLVWPDGQHLNLSYMLNTDKGGMETWYSSDAGKTMTQGGTLPGPLDREWLALDQSNNNLYLDYSHGYIGGPKSTGVYLVTSTDQGKTYKETARVDNEPAGHYAVDPFLCTSTEGRIYGAWEVSADFNTMDSLGFSYSDDHGKSFKGHQHLFTMNKKLGDTQERWILGGVAAYGKDAVIAYFPNYIAVTVDGVEYHPLITFYRISTDGGVTFSPPISVISQKEIEECVRSMAATDPKGVFIMTLPWATFDPYGRLHFVWQDNRAGVGDYKGEKMAKWHVRYASGEEPTKGLDASERVSEDVFCSRPPLDFLSCAADKTRFYVSWTEAPGAKNWDFSGDLYLGRKILKAPAKVGGNLLTHRK